MVLRAPEPPPAKSPPRPDVRAIYGAEFAWVYRTLRRLGGRERDLEDLAHDVFVVVHRRLDDYDPRRPLRPWLMGIAFRVVSDYRRRAGFRAEELSEDVADTAWAPRQEEAVAERDRRELVLEALEALD
ncbi:MAG: sigma-70 family RNA polymerase sigma factor, partial [Myxococcales bacterium]|nr:sigma-70 family RNA polymerase sigma factor [Myxococcales bacterium]